MTSKKRFASNIGFYAVGAFATKILQFLFVPIYSKFIDPSDMGTFNVVLATVSVAVPLLFQSIWEGTFRIAIEKGDEGRAVLANSLKYCLSLLLLYAFSFIIVSILLNIRYALFILLFAIGQVVVFYWQFAARAMKENKMYTISSVVSSAVSILLNLILIVVFRLGIYALFIANIAGSFSLFILLEYRLRLLKDINNLRFEKSLLVSIIKYSLPLAINYVSWWMMESCNNIIITSSVGSDQNGIYGMAMKFGTILAMITNVITMAWQEEAFRTYGDKDQYAYFNSVLNLMIRSLLCSVIVLIPITFIIYQYFVFGEYKNGAGLVTFIYVSAAFSALSYHLGSIFLARKESSIMFYTTLIGGLTNIVVSLILVRYIGIWGAVIGTFAGNLVNFGSRIPLLLRRIPLDLNSKMLLFLTVLCIIEGFICNRYATLLVPQLLIIAISTIFFFFINKDIVRLLYTKIANKYKKN
jgi:O-antigen/teichoic acid export membrane protein